MKHILFDLFLVSLGAGIGVVSMCLIQAGKAADRDFEMMERPASYSQYLKDKK